MQELTGILQGIVSLYVRTKTVLSSPRESPKESPKKDIQSTCDRTKKTSTEKTRCTIFCVITGFCSVDTGLLNLVYSRKQKTDLTQGVCPWAQRAGVARWRRECLASRTWARPSASLAICSSSWMTRSVRMCHPCAFHPCACAYARGRRRHPSQKANSILSQRLLLLRAVKPKRRSKRFLSPYENNRDARAHGHPS